MMRRLVLAVLLISLLCCARQAAAQACAFTVTTMNFGTYTQGNTQMGGTATGSWTGTCPPESWNIPLYAGLGAGATETTRYMTGPGGAEIAYEVFQDAGYTTNWGDTDTTDKTGTTFTPVTFYGLITGAQPAPGVYTDTLSTATTSFTVTVTVALACTITASNLNFGTFQGTVLNSTSTISVTCTKTTPYNVGLNAGTTTGATVTTRKMQNGTHRLGYSLYQNSTHTTNWGNTVGTDTVAGTGNGAIQNLTVYGQVPAATVPAAGNYTDTITATVTY